MLPLLAATCDLCLNLEERLAVVESDMKVLEELRPREGDEVALSWLMSDLATFAITQAAFEVDASMDDQNLTTPDEFIRKIIDDAQAIWDTLIEYLKDTHDLILHRLGMLAMLSQLNAGGYFSSWDTQDQADAVNRITQAKMQELMHATPKEFQSVDAPAVAGVTDSSDVDALTQDFFRSMIKIGTFHRDRDAYETEEQRQLHDRIVAIYHRLGELVF